MKISLQKKLNKNKTKHYLIVCKFKGYKVVNGVRKRDRIRDSLKLFLWIKPKGSEQKRHNKETKQLHPSKLWAHIDDFKAKFHLTSLNVHSNITRTVIQYNSRLVRY